MKSSELKNSSDNRAKKHNRFSGWAKTTTIALAGLFASCDKIPNDQIIVNPDVKTEKFSLEYQFSEGSTGLTIIDYNIFIKKNGDKFIGTIEQSDGLISNQTNIESDNIDALFDTISNKLDHDYITDKTRIKKDKKITKAKEIYKDSVLNRKTPSNGEVKIEYKSE